MITHLDPNQFAIKDGADITIDRCTDVRFTKTGNEVAMSITVIIRPDTAILFGASGTGTDIPVDFDCGVFNFDRNHFESAVFNNIALRADSGKAVLESDNSDIRINTDAPKGQHG